MVVKKEKKEAIMKVIDKENGHRGREGTIKTETERYWWPELHVEIKEWVKTCEQCTSLAPI